MKFTISLCIFIILLRSKELAAQPIIKENRIDTIDFLNPKQYPGDFIIKDKVTLRYRFMNFNRNVYKLSIEDKARSIYPNTHPLFSIFTDIKVPTVSKDKEAAPGEQPMENLFETLRSEEKNITKPYTDASEKLFVDIKSFKKDFDNLKELNILYKDLVHYSEDGRKPFTELMETKLERTNDLLTDKFNITVNRTDVLLGEALKRVCNHTIESLELKYEVIIKQYDNLKRIYTDLQLQLKGKTDVLNALLDGQEKIMESMSDVKIAYSKVTELKQGNFTTQLIEVYEKIDTSQFETISAPITGREDEITVKIDISAKDGANSTVDYKKFNGTYTGKVYGYKINFSTGIFLVWGKKLFDKTYRLEPAANDTMNTIIIKNENKNEVQPAIGALMHFYKKTPSWFGYGLNIGISVSDESKLNYHGGVSALFGEEQRIILSGGVTLRKVSEIADQYKEGQKIPKTQQLESVPTEEFYRLGYFLSITYNLRSN